MTIATDEAVQMLEHRWSVRYLETADAIEWRSPRGISGDNYRSDSLDLPPIAAVEDGRKHGEIHDRPRAAGEE